MRHWLIVLLCLLIVAIRGAVSSAQPSTVDPAKTIAALESVLVEVIARVEPCVVAVSRVGPRPTANPNQDLFDAFRRVAPTDPSVAVVGAGVFIDSSGLILTHYLAVRDGAEHTIILTNGNRYPATIRAADPRSGLAVLAVDPAAGSAKQSLSHVPSPANFPTIRFGDATSLRKGQFVIAIGNPYAIQADGQATASWGIITNLARKAPPETNFNNAPGPSGDFRTTLHHLGTLIQTDAKLGWSTGGGALVNLQGELIGLTTNAATIAGHEQPAGYAIPMNSTMRRIIETLKEGREVEYGLLGVGFGQTTLAVDSGNRYRLSVSQIYEGSPAARAGLRPGDVITRIGDQYVDDIDKVQLAVSSLPPETVTKIEYSRNGQPATTNVKLAKLAVSGRIIASHRPKPWLGLRVDYATTLDAVALAQAIASGAYDPAGCVLVTEVEPQSVAWQAGVRPGMFISHVGNERVTTPAEFYRKAHSLGSKFKIRLTQPITTTKELELTQ